VLKGRKPLIVFLVGMFAVARFARDSDFLGYAFYDNSMRRRLG
jgi:hypothetical protein